MKFKLMQIFYFLLLFSILTQGVIAASGGGNVGTWYGYVSINNTTVASDNTTVVSAYINSTSTIAGNTTVGAASCELSNCTGFYYINAQANTGENITFKICGVNASQGQQTFSAGPHSLLNLTINKSADGATCTYACGCTGGYCVHNYCSAASTYCGDGYCDTGESCSADNSACSSGQSCTSGCAATSGGGGAGGGGGGTVTSTITVVLSTGNANVTILSIAAGKMSNISISKTADIAFRQINVSVLNSVNNIKLIITKLSGLPGLTQFSGVVYQYIQIDKTNITDSDINKVFIKFAVSKAWLSSNGVDKTNISLYRWANNRWTELSTTYLSEDSSEVFYIAESLGLSYFLIGAKTVTPTVPTGETITCTESWSCTGWSSCQNNVKTRTCTDSNSCGTIDSKPLVSEACGVAVAGVAPYLIEYKNISLLMAAIIIAVAIVICALIILERRKIASTLGVAERGEHKKKPKIAAISFVTAGVVIVLVPVIFFIAIGDFFSLFQSCVPVFSTTGTVNGVTFNCVELRFVYILTYLCLILGSLLIISGLVKRVMETRK